MAHLTAGTVGNQRQFKVKLVCLSHNRVFHALCFAPAMSAFSISVSGHTGTIIGPRIHIGSVPRTSSARYAREYILLPDLTSLGNLGIPFQTKIHSWN